MSLSAGSVMGTLGLDSSGFSQGFLQAQTLINTFPAIITSFMANPLLGLVNVAATAFSGVTQAASAAADTIKEAFAESLHTADELNDMATNAGVAVEALSGLGLAAQQAGSGVGEVADSFKFLGKNVSEAMDGGKDAIETFSRLGVAFQDAQGQARPLEDIMFDVADAMANIPDAGDRTAASMGLLGRAGTGLIATLSQGKTQLKDQIALFEAWGVTVSGKAAASADKFGDLMGVISAAWTGVQNAIGEPLREALTPMLEGVVSWLTAHMPQITATVRATFTSVGEKLNELSGWINANWPQIVAFAGGIAQATLTAGGIIGNVLGKVIQGVSEATSFIYSAFATATAALSKIPFFGKFFGDVSGFNKEIAQFAEAGAAAAKSFTDSFNSTVGSLQGQLDKAAVAAAGGGSPISAGGSSPTSPPININVSVPDVGASTGQLAAALQAGVRSAATQLQSSNDSALKRIAIEQGGY